MNKKKIQKHLSTLFVPRDNGLNGVCFRTEYMNKDNEAYPVQQAVSEAQRKSGLSFDFSYTIAKIACNILADTDDWSDDDVITEAIDGQVPIYTYYIMEIYQSNNWAVDEARQEFGSVDSSKDAQMAWYSQISQMVANIKENLQEIAE